MSDFSNSLYARHDGLLTRAIASRSAQLPYPDFPESVKRIIVGSLRRAWRDLVEERKAALLALREPEITALLENKLNRMRESSGGDDGILGSMFETIIRDGAAIDYCGRSLDKRPDLTFRIYSRKPGLGRASERALFVECKILENQDSVRRYCQEGVGRFVRGEYAWAMMSAMMVGYVKSSLDLEGALAVYLTRLKSDGHDPFETTVLPRKVEQLSSEKPDAYESRHGRPWNYPGNGLSPGNISLCHLWLPARGVSGD